MGTFIHDAAVFVVMPSEEIEKAVDDLRDSMDEEYRPLVIGPVLGVVNSYVTYAFLPDGSKEGWDASDKGDRYRARFVAIFKGAYADGVNVRFGRDLFRGQPHVSLPFPEENR